ncbi:MAG: protein ndvB [Hyphomonadaceae bacterium]|nr:protein ndvB [Hyphomonadaceae bacterium]
MKLNHWRRALARGRRQLVQRAGSPWRDRTLIAGELFSLERLEKHARTLAAAHTIPERPQPRPSLARRLRNNAEALHAVLSELNQAVAGQEALSPAAEWIIDNYHIAERQIRDIRTDLPPGYYRRLPKLAAGHLAGYPRILGAVWAYVAHTDNHFEPSALCRYFTAYQEVAPLTIGELWAIPISLRFLLVENLRRHADIILANRSARLYAKAWTEARLRQPAGTILPIDLELSQPAFLLELAHGLRDHAVDAEPILHQLDEHLATEDLTVDALVQREQQRQVAATVSVRNIITSMRLINDVDWRILVERLSPVDAILNGARDYARMDFATRNLYRAAIEELARGAAATETAIAAAALDAARSNQDRARADPGYVLIGAGRSIFEQTVGYRAPIEAWPGRLLRALGVSGYVGLCALASIALLVLAAAPLVSSQAHVLFLVTLAALGLVVAADGGVAIVNHFVTRGFRATILPGMELDGAIPGELRTLVVMPTLLTSVAAIEDQVARLEVHFLTSPPGEIYFALLSDWTDADTEQRSDDDALLTCAARAIDALNRRHGPANVGARFYLLHRRRVWTDSEQCWMGWERKRGKLRELNTLLRGSTETTFTALDGQPPMPPPAVRYVITLDADTRLTRDAIRRLIGKMAHPLNAPRYDNKAGRVVEGYAILQPRITPAMPVGHEATLFLRVFSSMSGIDPYAAAASDVYQDLLGEGSYAGKGIYDIDAFEQALGERVPRSSLLSHDLFEGVFARSGLASDIEFVEEFPARYDTAALRHHRWARGDWQLLPWIVGSPKTPAGDRTRTPIIGRLKMLDNLRRSLAAPAAALALVLGFALPLPAALAWSGALLALIAIPPLMPVIAELYTSKPQHPLRHRLWAFIKDFRLALTQWALSVALLAHEAWLMADAALRTLVRLASRKRLLEWTPAAQAAFAATLSRRAYYRHMAGALVVATAALVVGVLSSTLPVATAFSLIWFASPAIAFWSSCPAAVLTPPLSPADARGLRLIARRTWRYFETFVTARDNYLPPDNFQTAPRPVVARRTSPTNIGLYLLSIVAAREFGWISTTDASERFTRTLDSLAKLERYRGHFFNWYDTGDLRALEPRYVSSVDSGNLAGHLIAAAHSCEAWAKVPDSIAIDLTGAADAVHIARSEACAFRQTKRLPGLPWSEVSNVLDRIEQRLSVRPYSEGELDSLIRLANTLADTVRAHAQDDQSEASADLIDWIDAIPAALTAASQDTRRDGAIAERLMRLAHEMRSFALAMDFSFLIDPDRLLLSIGYRGADNALDPSCYDLLASEARLASFLAIAKGDAPTKHWFRLGRGLTPLKNGAALISWSGSMFEYLMPSLVMQEPTHSLLHNTHNEIVQRQMEYAASRGAPWGVSESAYSARDIERTYQYSSFGIPDLGLKRGLADNYVVSPYATALAALVAPEAAARNFERLAGLGALGRYGFIEAIDFTPQRLPEGASLVLVEAFMAHHQGMTIAAIANVVLDGVIRRRFHAEPMVRAAELLLHERTPRVVRPAMIAHPAKPAYAAAHTEMAQSSRRAANPQSATPIAQLLSNGHYAVMLTGAGSGYSAWGDIAITRWREDPTCDAMGSYLYLRDVETGACWSPTFQPLLGDPNAYEIWFEEERAEFVRHDRALVTSMDVLVSPEDDAEVRRITLTNRGATLREIEVTSYLELALAPPRADAAHPAFSKLFVETEQLARSGALLARRRRRAPEEEEIWAGHRVIVEGQMIGAAEFETDRARLLGRGRTPQSPLAILNGSPLTGATGAVLDPIFALRRRVRVLPGQTTRLHFWTIAAKSRPAALDLIDRHGDASAYDRVTAQAWTQTQVQLSHLGIDRVAAALYQQLGAHLLFATPAMRAHADAIKDGAAPQSELWSLGISGDLPILLVRISEEAELGIVKETLRAFEYLRTKRLAFDLVIVNERAASYLQELQAALEHLARTSRARPHIGVEPPLGGVYLLRSDLATARAKALLLAAAHVVLSGERGTLADQLARRAQTVAPTPPRPRPPGPASDLSSLEPASDLQFTNGVGGFAADGAEYVMSFSAGAPTPAPWINVIANPDFGFQVSETGASSTWSINSRERQLTPWANDPVSAPTGQAFFIRDNDTLTIWSPTAAPMPNAARFNARHGFGYSVFEYLAHGVKTALTEYVALNDPVRISRLVLRNTSSARLRLSITAYVEWALAPSRAQAAHIITERDAATGALFARNAWAQAFQGRVAFADLLGAQTSLTGDRREFLGRNGSLANPIALSGGGALSGRVGAGLDPCAALQADIALDPGEAKEIVLLLGDATDAASARALIERYRKADLAQVLDDVRTRWRGLLSAIEVKTPDRSFDLMVNGWLLYQALACRIWARAGYYQASGAYGFRDQLQDIMAFAVIEPARAREHILRCASRQFVEGDVQHWWLPETSQGVRTRISDDRVWLAAATAHYACASGDVAILNETAPFLQGPLLAADQHEAFFTPERAQETASLYEHCARALDISLATGAHGAPLIGGGDWNDGMNRIGHEGRGESVWLGWFLIRTLRDFSPIAEQRGDIERAAIWRKHADAMADALNRHAWDGEWFVRGWYDDGAPLGSASSDECRIDSIAQSWAVLSGAGERQLTQRAMASVERDLVRSQEAMALLFTPPFDQTQREPGYIKGYPPGIRENGGQYTHAALWSVMALAELGEGDKAAALFWMLNPINHTRTRTDVHRYKVEPYAVAADIYAAPMHLGRGGWTWYTGSAALMHRAAVEYILGLRFHGDHFTIDPCIPKSWPEFAMTLRLDRYRYDIRIDNSAGVSRGVAHVRLDDVALTGAPARIPAHPGPPRRVDVVMGASRS